MVTEYLKLGELGCKLGSNSSRCSRQINHFRLNSIFVLAYMIQCTRTRVVPTSIQNRILNILGKEYLVMNSKSTSVQIEQLFQVQFCLRCVANINVLISLDSAPLLPKQKTSDIHNFVKMSQKKRRQAF